MIFSIPVLKNASNIKKIPLMVVGFFAALLFFMVITPAPAFADGDGGMGGVITEPGTLVSYTNPVEVLRAVNR